MLFNLHSRNPYRSTLPIAGIAPPASLLAGVVPQQGVGAGGTGQRAAGGARAEGSTQGTRSARRRPFSGHKPAPAARKPPCIPPSLLPSSRLLRAPNPSPHLPLLQQPGHIRIVVIPNVLLLSRPCPTLPLRLASPSGRAQPQRQAQQGPASGRRHLVPELAAAGGRPRLPAGAGAGGRKEEKEELEREREAPGDTGGGLKGERQPRRDMAAAGIQPQGIGPANESSAVFLQTHGWAAPEVLPLHPLFKAGRGGSVSAGLWDRIRPTALSL